MHPTTILTVTTARRRGLTAVVAALALVVGTQVLPAAATEDDGLDVDASTLYVVDTGAEVVHVEVTLDLRNTIPPRRRGDLVETVYFDRFLLPVAGDVRDVVAEGPQGALGTSVLELDGFDYIELRFASNLLHDRPRRITVRYDLPSAPPRSDDITRVNRAYAAWYVAAVGDPGHADLRIEAPREFELGIAATTLRLRGQRGAELHVFEATDVTDVDSLYFAISLVDEDNLTSTTVKTGDVSVDVRGWPGDATWSSFTTDLVERGMPVIEALVGAPLQDPTLAVLETSGGAHLGFSGFFEQDGTIEVSDALDGETVLHELTHAWVNTRLFSERWLSEGVTQEVTRRAAAALDVEAEPAPTPDPDAEVAIPLNEWGWGDPLDPTVDELDEWGYDASYAVANLLLAELDDEALAAVLGAALRGEITYRGDGAPERLIVVDDWQQALDLVEEVGGVEVTQLYRDHVLTPGQRRAMDARDDARTTYAAFVTASDGWSAPFAVRRAMARWQFDDVDELIAAAEATLAHATEVDAALVALGGALPGDVEVAYETSEDLEDVTASLEQLEELAARLQELRTRAAGVGALERVGLLGTAPTATDDAVVAASAGDVEAATAFADAEQRRLDGAAAAGWLRLGVTLAGLLLVAALLRRRRRRTPPDAPSDTPVEAPPSAAGPLAAEPLLDAGGLGRDLPDVVPGSQVALEDEAGARGVGGDVGHAPLDDVEHLPHLPLDDGEHRVGLVVQAALADDPDAVRDEVADALADAERGDGERDEHS